MSTKNNEYSTYFKNLSSRGSWNMQMSGSSFQTSVLASPGVFARQNLLYLESIVLYHQTPKGFFVHRKDYNSYQIVYTLSGQGKLEYLKREYLLSEGSCFLIDCKKEHSYYTIGEETWVHHGLQFNGHQMSAVFEYLLLLNSIVVDLTDSETVNSIHKQLAAAGASKLVSSDIIINQLLTQLVGTILLCNQAVSQSQLTSKVREICNYIDSHYKTIRVIDEIAENCFISKYHMCREFKRQTGKTVITYLSDMRLTAAKTMLQQSTLPISYIAKEVGYESENYFYYIFKKSEGITPLQYRRQLTGL